MGILIRFFSNDASVEAWLLHHNNIGNGVVRIIFPFPIESKRQRTNSGLISRPIYLRLKSSLHFFSQPRDRPESLFNLEDG